MVALEASVSVLPRLYLAAALYITRAAKVVDATATAA